MYLVRGFGTRISKHLKYVWRKKKKDQLILKVFTIKKNQLQPQVWIWYLIRENFKFHERIEIKKKFDDDKDVFFEHSLLIEFLIADWYHLWYHLSPSHSYYRALLPCKRYFSSTLDLVNKTFLTETVNVKRSSRWYFAWT